MKSIMLILCNFIGEKSCNLHFNDLDLNLNFKLIIYELIIWVLFIIFQLLVDWTRGKNLIFSSAAPSVNELRGPYDVANLSSLLGLSMERAKAAISKNCRYEKFSKP